MENGTQFFFLISISSPLDSHVFFIKKVLFFSRWNGWKMKHTGFEFFRFDGRSHFFYQLQRQTQILLDQDKG